MKLIKLLISIVIIQFCSGRLLGQCDGGGSFTAGWSWSSPTCANPDSGSITVTSAVGTGDVTPPYTYEWSNGQSSETISGLAAGTYYFSVYDGNGCYCGAYETTLDKQNVPPIFTLWYYDPVCTNDNGSYAIQMTSGTAPYIYSWSTGSNDSIINNLAGGSYSITITDANNCSTTGNWDLAINDITLDVSVTVKNDGCYDFESGYVAVTNVTNANGNIDYEWDNGSTDYWTGYVAPGNYTVTVTDDNGCTGEASGDVKQSDPITVTYQATDETCYELNNGTVTIQAQGGNENYSYDWSPVGSGDEQTGLPPGTYTVIVSDDNGCSGSAEAIVNPASAITLVTEAYFVSCNQSSTYLDIEYTGGTGDLNYAWTDGGTAPISFGQSSNIITDIKPNQVYTVIVTDENGCSTTFGWSYTTPPPYHTNASASICAGQSYQFHGNTYTIAGSYPVTLIAQNGCDSIVTLNLTVNPTVTPTITIAGNNDLCVGASTTLIATISNGGGTPAYQWQVNGFNVGNNSNTFTSGTLTNGALITCILTSNASCLSTTTATSNTETITIGNSVIPSISIIGNNALCAGQPATFTALANGGGSTPAYQWKVNGSNVGTNSNTYIANAPASGSTIMCILTSSASCATTTTANSNVITVTVKPSPMANAGAGSSFCAGDSAILGGSPTASGGTSPYVYSWSPNNNLSGTSISNPVVTSTLSTRYSVTVTDANGCVASSSDSVTVKPIPATPTLGSNSPVLTFDTIKLTAGSLAGATYQWRGPDNFSSTLQNPSIPRATGLMSGAYILVITDSGCSSIPDTIRVNVSSFPITGLVTNITCNGDSNAMIILTVPAGIGPCTYLWSNGSTIQNISGLTWGIYSVTVTDTTSHTATQSFTVTQPAVLSLSGNVQNTCSNIANGGIITTASGGVPPYIYFWSNGGTSAVIDSLDAGHYAETVTDANGCQNVNTYVVDTLNTTVPSINIAVNPSSTICSGTKLIFTTSTTNSGSNPVYQWKKNGIGVGSSSPVYIDSTLNSNDLVWVVMTSNSPCASPTTVNSDTIKVTVIPIPDINPVDDQVLCSGSSTYAINFTGSVPNTVFNWTNSIYSIGIADSGSGNIASFIAMDNGSDLVKSIITVTPVIISGQSCSGGAIKFAITVNPAPVISISGNSLLCTGSHSPGILFSSSQPYATFSWTNSNTTIGLPVSGTGNIPAFNAVDTGSFIDSAVIAVTSSAPQVAYVTNNGYGNIYAINTTTNTALDTIAVGSQPSGLSVSPDGLRVYVTNYGGGNVSVINTMTHLVIATINTGSEPYGLVVSPDNKKVYVANVGSNSIVAIDAVADTVAYGYTINTNPQALVISPDGNMLYATFPNANAIGVINLSAVTFTPVFVGSSPDGIAISPDGSKLFVACNNSNFVSVINTSSLLVIDTINVGTTPREVCFSPDGSRAYVSNVGSNNVSVINTANDSLLNNISVGSGPWGLCVTPDGSKLYVNNAYGGSVSVINTSSNIVSATLNGFSFPQSFGNFFIAGNSCTASKRVTIKVTPAIATNLSQAICAGSTYGGHDSTGVYIDTFTTVSGCDSIRTLHLTVNHTVTTTITQSICHGTSFLAGGQSFDSTGIYQITLPGAAANGCDSAITLHLTVANTIVPQITISANQTTICTGDSVTFTATSNGGGNSPSYQWKVNGHSVVGATGATYSSSSLNNGDVISCLLTSSSSCASPDTAVSSDIAISINTSVNPTVTISANPSGAICTGTNVTFTAAPTGGGNSPSYQWKVNGNAVTGATGVTFSSSSFNNGDIITCVLASSSSCASPSTATSAAIVITVNPTVIPSLTITANPAGAICTGTNVTFTANPTEGGNSPAYQWKVNDNVVSGANGVTYSSSSLTNGDVITCVLTSNATCASPNSANSNQINMVVSNSLTPSITISPNATGAICSGTTITFTATVSGGGTAPAYQWQENSNAILNATGATYSSDSLTNGEMIGCVLTSNSTCATTSTANSNMLTMVVSASVIPAVSISQSPTGSVCAGSIVMFTAAANGGGTNPDYQWQINGSNVGNNAGSFISSTLSNYDVVACVLSSSLSCASPDTAVSNGIALHILPSVTPSITVTPEPQTICSGGSVTFYANINHGGSTPVYQWSKNGIGTGSNSSNYTDSSTLSNDTISCLLISNATCAVPDSVSASPAGLHIYPAPNATITPSGPDTICPGLALSAPPNNFSYRWNTGATTQSIYPVVSGNYDVTVTNFDNCSASSVPVSVIVNPLPETPVITKSGYVLTSSASTGNQWLQSNVPLNSDTFQSYTVTISGWYAVQVTNSDACSSTSDSVYVNVTGLQQITLTQAVKVQPNPFGTQFELVISSNINNLSQLSYTLTDALGRVITQSNSLQYHNTLNMADQASGIYLLRVLNGMDIVTFKVVKGE